MPTYVVQHPETGRKLSFESDEAPTEEEIDGLFEQIPAPRETTPVQSRTGVIGSGEPGTPTPQPLSDAAPDPLGEFGLIGESKTEPTPDTTLDTTLGTIGDVVEAGVVDPVQKFFEVGAREVREGFGQLDDGAINAFVGALRIGFSPLRAIAEPFVGEPAEVAAKAMGASDDLAESIKEYATIAGELAFPVGGIKALARPLQKTLTADEIILGEAIAHKSVGAAAVTQGSPLSHALGQRASLAWEGVKDTVKHNHLIDKTGGKAITPLRRWAESSPSMAKYTRALEADEVVKGKPLSGASYFEAVSRNVGRFQSRLMDIMDPMARAFQRGIFRDVPKDINLRILDELRGVVKTKEGAQLRNLLDDVRQYSIDRGVDIGHIKDYFPRVYNPRVLVTKAREFEGVLIKHGIPADEAESIRRRIIGEDGFLPTPKVRSADRETFVKGVRPTAEKTRTLDFIPDAELAPFLQNNVKDVIKHYIENAVKRAEWTRIHGPDGGKLHNAVNKGIKETLQATGKAPSKWQIERSYDLANALQRNYHPIDSQAWRMANRWNNLYQYMRTLPLATISSLSEPLVIFIRGRPSAGMRGAARAMRHAVKQAVRIGFKNVPKSEITRGVEESGLGLDAAITERLTSAFGGEATKGAAIFFKAIGLEQLTRFNRVWGFETGKLMVEGHLEDLIRGVGIGKTNKWVTQLRELGIDPQTGIQWVKNGASKKDPFYENVINAGIRFTNEVVMAPRATVRPMWHSNPHFQTIAQLKGFQTTFGNTVIKRVARELVQKGAYNSVTEATKAATVGSMMVYVASLGNELRDWIKYESSGETSPHRDEAPTTTIVRAIDRAGFTGVAQIGLDATIAHRFGSSGPAQILGPTVTQAAEWMKAIGEWKESGKTTAISRAASNSIPVVSFHPTVRKEVREALR